MEQLFSIVNKYFNCLGPLQVRKGPKEEVEVSLILTHMSDVACHVSHVMCHMSPCNMSFFSSSFFDKLVKIIGGGSVINGAYPV